MNWIPSSSPVFLCLLRKRCVRVCNCIQWCCFNSVLWVKTPPFSPFLYAPVSLCVCVCPVEGRIGYSYMVCVWFGYCFGDSSCKNRNPFSLPCSPYELCVLFGDVVGCVYCQTGLCMLWVQNSVSVWVQQVCESSILSGRCCWVLFGSFRWHFCFGFGVYISVIDVYDRANFVGWSWSCSGFEFKFYL